MNTKPSLAVGEGMSVLEITYRHTRADDGNWSFRGLILGKLDGHLSLLAKANVASDVNGFSRQALLARSIPRACSTLQKLTPLSPQNVLRDIIASALEKEKIEWYGFHAFRRGLATNLRALGVDDLTIKEILRPSDVSVTRASYIKRVDEKAVEAMDRLEAELRKPVQSVVAKSKARRQTSSCP